MSSEKHPQFALPFEYCSSKNEQEALLNQCVILKEMKAGVNTHCKRSRTFKRTRHLKQSATAFIKEHKKNPKYKF